MKKLSDADYLLRLLELWPFPLGVRNRIRNIAAGLRGEE